VWGSTLTFTFAVQVITGIFLWMAYSPSSQTAWESVYYIQYELTGGWFLRGLHHFTAQAMNVLLVLHLMQVVIDGAYKAPREVNFWFGIGLLALTLALSLTGYLLPWDQKGYAATKVTTNIAAITPFIGETIQKLIVGGADYGHHTLTRFFALHAGLLPALMVLLVVGHVALFRRHGITAKQPLTRPDAAFWPDQVLKDAVACLAVLAAVMVLTVWHHGAGLTAPADPSEPYSAPRPEWYFLSLFQFLKYFKGGTEVWGAIVIPGILFGVVCVLPFIGRRRLGHIFAISYLVAVILGAAVLTWIALREDADNASFQAAVRQSEAEAARVIELAKSPQGIPPSGAVTLLREDPFLQGPKLFSKYCASCHRYDGHDGLGNTLHDAQMASDLKGFGSREWLNGLLDPQRIDSIQYFGGTKLKDGKMVKFVHDKVAKYPPEKKLVLEKAIAALSAEAGLPGQRALDEKDGDLIAEGRKAIRELSCTDCHAFLQPDEEATAPDLTAWASRDWVMAFIGNPAQPRFYGKRTTECHVFMRMVFSSRKQLVSWQTGYAEIGTAPSLPRRSGSSCCITDLTRRWPKK
jgi:ubiquinol-cytochrome c reductase cytochrome b subunit